MVARCQHEIDVCFRGTNKVAKAECKKAKGRQTAMAMRPMYVESFMVIIKI